MNRLYPSLLPGSLLVLIAACHSSSHQELVPNIVDYTIADATTKLKSYGLVLGTQTTGASVTVPAGEIISESPVAGTAVGVGSAVNVLVSTGPAAAAVPAAAPTAVALAQPAAGGAAVTSPALTSAVSNSAAPAVALTQGADGNLYGVSASGGANHNQGAFFRVTAGGMRTLLYSFGSHPDDAVLPDVNLVQGTDGNFYGTSATGGSFRAGTVYRITPAGVETVLVSFPGGGAAGEPASPAGGLLVGADGSLYGTTRAGGVNGTGVVYLITPAGALSTLYSFAEDPR